MIDIREHGGSFGGGANLNGKILIDFFIQESQPTPNKIGDVWVKTTENLSVKKFGESSPPAPNNRDMWQKIKNLDYTINVEKINASFNKNGTEIHLDLDGNAIINGIPQDKIALWENIYSKAFANLDYTYYWDSVNSEWVSVEAFMWDGSVWVQISYLYLFIYKDGTELTPVVKGYSSYSTNVYLENETNIYLEGKSLSSNEYISATTDILVDLTEVTKITLVADVGPNTKAWLEANSVKGANLGTGQAKTSIIKDRYAVLGDNTITLDVSTLSGSYYIYVWSQSYQAIGIHSKVYIKQIWIE